MEQNEKKRDDEMSASKKAPQAVSQSEETWAKVVFSKETEVLFYYIPMPEGAKVLSPPDGVLRKGNEKFKLCVIGTFSKGTRPFSVVKRFAQRFWEQKGLCVVYQKEDRVFFSDLKMRTV